MEKKKPNRNTTDLTSTGGGWARRISKKGTLKEEDGDEDNMR